MEGEGERPITVSSMMQEINVLKEKFKGEDDGYGGEEESPYANLEKATVLQEARILHDATVVTQHPRRCAQLITKMLHLLLAQGENFTSTEMTEVFFGVTKLFQSDDMNLRRMVYLFIKEVAETCSPDDVIIVTSSLVKDMNSQEDLFRANAIRVLSKIVDTTMLGGIERYVKQAIVDRNAFVASSALIAGIYLIQNSPEVVRRWVNEVQDALSSSAEMVQFHALALIYQIRQHDRLAVSKIVTQLSRGSVRSSLGTCLLIRYTSRLLVEQGTSLDEANAYRFLESCLRHKSDMVVYEAARALCSLPGSEQRDLTYAITALEMFLVNSRPSMRFCAMKTLSELAVRAPAAVSRCMEEMESLVNDSNRSIATLAITTLLKTGTVSNLDRLLKQISSFIGDISDEFKVVVVDAIRQLCLKNQSRQRAILGFLAGFYREEGGIDFKRAIVNSIVEVMEKAPDLKELALLYLCEFIEDCEFSDIITQVLELLAKHGPTTSFPSRYVRFIFNRVILEGAAVRAAAVTALGRFASQVPSLRDHVLDLLERSLLDESDEVRERATVLVQTLRHAQAESGSAAAVDAGGAIEQKENEGDGETAAAAGSSVLPQSPGKSASGPADRQLDFVLAEPLPMSFNGLERSIRKYLQAPHLSEGQALNLDTLPIVEDIVEPDATTAAAAAAGGLAAVAAGVATGGIPGATIGAGGVGAGAGGVGGIAAGSSAAAAGAGSASEAEDEGLVELYKMPEMSALGRAFRSTGHTMLTESEMEYVVDCVKHIFENHVVLQFTVRNTIDDQMLKHVSVQVEMAEEGVYEVLSVHEADEVRFGEVKRCYVVLTREAVAPATMSCELHFNVVQVDATTGEVDGDPEGFSENYPLEDLEISTSDFMAKVSLGDFRRAWENLGTDAEMLGKFALSFSNLADALKAVIEFLGMQACDGTGQLPAGSTPKTHVLHLSGRFIGNIPVMVRAQLALDESSGVVLKMAVRSESQDVSNLVAECVQ